MVFDPRAKMPKDPELEKQKALLFGKHVSKEKAIVLLIVTSIACALPLLTGLRLWDSIPEMISSGRTLPNGKEDAIPRWALVYVMPGFFLLLNLITHIQLAYHQKKMIVPPSHIRLMGRWGFSVLSVLFCSGMVFKSVGQDMFQSTVVIPAAMGLLLAIAGSHMFDCQFNSKISLGFLADLKDEQSWKKVHRFAGYCWMAAGIVIIAMAMAADGMLPVCAGVFAAALIAQAIYSRMA